MNRHNKPEILVVDDDKELASALAELISSRLQIPALSESNVDKVIEIVRSYNIKVLVLDQRMPKMSGTELYQKIKREHPYIKAVMITGEVDRKEVADAMNQLGYEGFIEKGDLKELPNKVIQAYVKYEIGLSKVTNNTPLIIYNPIKTRLYTKKYEISSIYIINENYIFPNKWETQFTLEAAEKKTEETIEYEDELIISSDIALNQHSNFSGHFKWLPSFKTEINAAITKTYGLKHNVIRRQRKKIETLYKLQDNIDEGKTAVKKDYERNPVYAEYGVLIKRLCRICGHSEMCLATVYKRLPKVATRVIIYYTDKTKSIIDTGYTTL